MKKAIVFFCLIAIGCSEKKVVQYYDNGVILKQGKLVNGLKEGKWTYFLESGDTTFIEYYFSDSLYKKDSYSNNRLFLSQDYENGVRNGKSSYFYENGNVKCINFFKEDVIDGENICYYENGNVETESIYVKGTGTNFIQYYPNGKIAVTADTIGEGPMVFYDSLEKPSVKVSYKNFQPMDTIPL